MGYTAHFLLAWGGAIGGALERVVPEAGDPGDTFNGNPVMGAFTHVRCCQEVEGGSDEDWPVCLNTRVSGGCFWSNLQSRERVPQGSAAPAPSVFPGIISGLPSGSCWLAFLFLEEPNSFCPRALGFAVCQECLSLTLHGFMPHSELLG